MYFQLCKIYVSLSNNSERNSASVLVLRGRRVQQKLDLQRRIYDLHS